MSSDRRATWANAASEFTLALIALWVVTRLLGAAVQLLGIDAKLANFFNLLGGFAFVAMIGVAIGIYVLRLTGVFPALSPEKWIALEKARSEVNRFQVGPLGMWLLTATIMVAIYFTMDSPGVSKTLENALPPLLAGGFFVYFRLRRWLARRSASGESS